MQSVLSEAQVRINKFSVFHAEATNVLNRYHRQTFSTRGLFLKPLKFNMSTVNY